MQFYTRRRFSKIAQKLPIIWATFARNYVAKNFKYRPIWSHWTCFCWPASYEKALGNIKLSSRYKSLPNTKPAPYQTFKIGEFLSNVVTLTRMYDKFIFPWIISFTSVKSFRRFKVAKSKPVPNRFPNPKLSDENWWWDSIESSDRNFVLKPIKNWRRNNNNNNGSSNEFSKLYRIIFFSFFLLSYFLTNLDVYSIWRPQVADDVLTTATFGQMTLFQKTFCQTVFIKKYFVKLHFDKWHFCITSFCIGSFTLVQIPQWTDR